MTGETDMADAELSFENFINEADPKYRNENEAA